MGLRPVLILSEDVFNSRSGTVIAVALTSQPQRAGTRDREVRSLLQASKALDCDDLLILTAATAGQETVEWFGTRRSIRLQPLAEWGA